MELFIGIPFGIIGVILFVIGSDKVLANAMYLSEFLRWSLGFPLGWGIVTALIIGHPLALVVFVVVSLLTAGVRGYFKYQHEFNAPLSQEYYTGLKRQDAAQAVADWDARAEELLIEAGVACICPTTPVVTHLTWEDRRITKTKRHPVLYCPVHAWRGLELARSPKH